MPSIAAIHQVAHRARDPTWESQLNCGAINSTLRDTLNEEFGQIADLVTGEVAAKPRRRFGAEHAWVRVDAEHVAEGTPLIVDGALDQFAIGPYERGETTVALMPVEDFPHISVIARHDQYNHPVLEGLYDHFLPQQNYGPVSAPV